MKEKKNKVMLFIKDHKKVIIGTSIAVVGGVAAIIIGKNVFLKTPEVVENVCKSFEDKEKSRIANGILRKNEVDIPIKIGERATHFWRDGKDKKAIYGIVTKLCPKDLGKFGEQFIGHEGITEDTPVNLALMTFFEE